MTSSGPEGPTTMGSRIPSAPSLKPALSPKRSSKGTVGGMRKNISFGNNQTLLFEKDIENDDEEAKNTVWYSKKEMKSIRKDLKKSIKKGEISRGLETYAGDFGAENKLKRINHMKSILALQNAQKECGIQDEMGLQSLSRSLSADNLRKARQLASLDSTQAFEEYQEILQQNALGLGGTARGDNMPGHFSGFTKTSTGAAVAGKNATFDTKPMQGLRKQKGAAAFMNAAAEATANSDNPGLGGLRRAQKSTPNMFLSGLESTKNRTKKASAKGLAALKKQLIPNTDADC